MADDLAESLIDYALGLIEDDKAGTKLKHKLEKAKSGGFENRSKHVMKLPDLLREAGVPINDALAQAIIEEVSHPLDYVHAVIDDKDSNLIACSYQEGWWCDKLRRGEQGGLGSFYSRHAHFAVNSYLAVSYGADLDKALDKKDLPSITAVVSKLLAKSVEAISDPDIRFQVAKKLLAGEALHTVEDGCVSQMDGDEGKPKYIPENLGVRLFNEILDNVETVSAVGEQFGQQTLVDLMYLTQLLATHVPRKSAREFIEQTHGSRIVEFLKTLPNGKDYLKFVSTELCDEAKSNGGAS